jgi:hypothetical protein
MSRADERLAAALAAEHAAVFGFGVLGSRLDATTIGLASGADLAHRGRRDSLIMLLTGRQAKVPAALPAYALPNPVTDQASALQLAISIEERTAAVWRAALIDTEADDRKVAVDALSDCAVRAVRFRRAAGLSPTTVPYPGRLSN